MEGNYRFKRKDPEFLRDPFKRSDWIERKRDLLEWINSRRDDKDTGSLENHLCIANILKRCQWRLRNDDYLWEHDNHEEPLPILAALRVELELQLQQDKQWHIDLRTGRSSS